MKIKLFISSLIFSIIAAGVVLATPVFCRADDGDVWFKYRVTPTGLSNENFRRVEYEYTFVLHPGNDEFSEQSGATSFVPATYNDLLDDATGSGRTALINLSNSFLTRATSGAMSYDFDRSNPCYCLRPGICIIDDWDGVSSWYSGMVFSGIGYGSWTIELANLRFIGMTPTEEQNYKTALLNADTENRRLHYIGDSVSWSSDDFLTDDTTGGTSWVVRMWQSSSDYVVNSFECSDNFPFTVMRGINSFIQYQRYGNVHGLIYDPHSDEPLPSPTPEPAPAGTGDGITGLSALYFDGVKSYLTPPGSSLYFSSYYCTVSGRKTLLNGSIHVDLRYPSANSVTAVKNYILDKMRVQSLDTRTIDDFFSTYGRIDKYLQIEYLSTDFYKYNVTSGNTSGVNVGLGFPVVFDAEKFGNFPEIQSLGYLADYLAGYVAYPSRIDAYNADGSLYGSLLYSPTSDLSASGISQIDIDSLSRPGILIPDVAGDSSAIGFSDPSSAFDPATNLFNFFDSKFGSVFSDFVQTFPVDLISFCFIFFFAIIFLPKIIHHSS